MREEAREKKRKENIAKSQKRNCDQFKRYILATKNKQEIHNQQNIRKIRAKFQLQEAKRHKVFSSSANFQGIMLVKINCRVARNSR